MTGFELDEVCREASLRLGLRDVLALPTTGTVLQGEKVGVIYDEDFDDGVRIYVDVGLLNERLDEAKVFGELLDINLGLTAASGEAFVRHAESGHILFRGMLPLHETSPASLASVLLDYVALIRELRQGPLACVAHPLEVEKTS